MGLRRLVLQLYVQYLERMELALRVSPWLVGSSFTMADIAMTPYVNRLAALAMEGVWAHGRLPRVADWFDRIRARPTFAPSFIEWLPPALAEEMRSNGTKSWPEIARSLQL
jgi:glutathione S-transferase